MTARYDAVADFYAAGFSDAGDPGLDLSRALLDKAVAAAPGIR